MRSASILLLSALLLLTPVVSNADEYGTPVSGWAYLTVALMVVDVGAAGANLFNMGNGTPSKPTANFSIGTGLVSYGLVGLVLLNEDDPELRNGFSLMMGAAGTAALVTGILARRHAGSADESPEKVSNFRVLPAVIPDGNRGKSFGFQLDYRF
jgi:hypothetical protein